MTFITEITFCISRHAILSNYSIKHFIFYLKESQNGFIFDFIVNNGSRLKKRPCLYSKVNMQKSILKMNRLNDLGQLQSCSLKCFHKIYHFIKTHKPEQDREITNHLQQGSEGFEWRTTHLSELAIVKVKLESPIQKKPYLN